MDKFSSLVHYIIATCDDPKRLGSIRLNKILWFSDIMSYRKIGQSITGTQYKKRKHGPVPAHVIKATEELEDSKLISVKHPTAQFDPREYMSLAEPDTTAFDKQELEIVDLVLRNICDSFSADEISEMTHDDIWKAADDGEDIPLSATLVSEPGDYGPSIVGWADKVVESRIAI